MFLNNHIRRLVRYVLAAVFIASAAGVVTAALRPGAERAAATPIATFDTSSAETLRPAPSAGTPASRNMYNRPSLAAARFPGTTRLFRTIVRSQNDNVNLAQILLETQYKDVSSPNATWRPVDFGALGNRGSVGNFVQSDSTLYAFDTIALRSSAGNGQYIAVSRSSTNGGIRWRQGWSLVQLPTTWSMKQIYLYQGIIVLTDGTWVMPAYSNGNVFLLASAPGDHGKTWRAVSRPYASHYTEATVAQRPDGRLVMAARYEIGRNESTEARRFKMGALGFRLSDRAVLRGDQLADIQWSAPRVNLPNVDQHGDLPLGVSPRMTRVGRYLLLTFGRPGNRLSWSTDGIDWSGSDPGGFYSNLPTFTSPCRELPGYIPCKALGSSGYIGVAVTDPQRGEGYLAFDACHTWSCEPVGSDYRIPENASWPAGATDQRVTLLRFQLNPQLVDGYKDPDDAPDRAPSGEWPTVPSPSSTSIPPTPATPQEVDSCSQEISADLGERVEVVDDLCVDGWAYIDSCPGCGGDTQQVVRRVDGSWSVVLAFPIAPDQPRCRAEWEAKGMPAAILDRTNWPCTEAPPPATTTADTGNGSPATTAAAAARFQQWIRAYGSGDLETYCDIAAPANDATGLPRDECPSAVSELRNQPADELASLAQVTVDTNQVTEVEPGRVEIGEAAISYPTPISNPDSPTDAIWVMAHDGTDWYLAEYPSY